MFIVHVSVIELLFIAIVVVALMIYATVRVRVALTQLLCKHEEYRETMACDAICTKCGKNLGFIGKVRGDK